MAKDRDRRNEDEEPVRTRRNLLDIRKKESMLAVLIRNRDAYEAIQDVLLAKHVRAFSEPLGLVWSTVRRFYKQYKDLPDRTQLEDELNDRITENPDLLAHDEHADVDEFVDYAFDDKAHGRDISRSDKHVRVALDTCRLLMEELAIAEAQEKLQSNATVPVDLPNILEKEMARISEIQSIVTKPIERVFDEGWEDEAPIVLRPTGVDPLDKMFGGGPAGGEVNMFFAPYGVCKTTLGTIVTYNSAEQAAELDDGHGPKPVSLIVSTEMLKREFRERILVYGGQIPRTRIRKFLSKQMSITDFCQASKPAATRETEYEQYLFKSNKKFQKEFLNERERLERAMKITNRYIKFIDFSSSNETVGNGGMRELANYISAEVRRDNLKPLQLVVDHVSAMADRMMDTGKYRREDLTEILKNMPRQARDWVATKYDIPVLLFHQFSGAINARKSPGADLSHSDAEGCKSIGKYCDFAVVCGHPTDEPNKLQVTKWKCTKHRREPPSQYMLVGIDGRFHRLLDVSAEYVVQGNSILEAPSHVRERGRERNKRSAYELSATRDSQARRGVDV